MVTNTQDVGTKMDAGLCLHAKRQMRPWPWSWAWAWGWGKKKMADLSKAETECPWAGVAEWLRVAHSLLDDKTVELSRNADR